TTYRPFLDPGLGGLCFSMTVAHSQRAAKSHFIIGWLQYGISPSNSAGCVFYSCRPTFTSLASLLGGEAVLCTRNRPGSIRMFSSLTLSEGRLNISPSRCTGSGASDCTVTSRHRPVLRAG